jgi:hypothetical protein
MAVAKWKQGEHIFICGDTGQGKTYLESKLLRYRGHVMYLRNKPDDIVFDTFRKVASTFDIGKWRFDNAGKAITRWMVQPEYKNILAQRREFKAAYDKAWNDGAWTVVVDEAFYQTKKLKLGDDIDILVTGGRSKHITMIVGCQRPAWISLFPMSQSTHAFIFGCEGKDLKRLAEAYTPRIIKPVQELDQTKHDFVYYNRITRQVHIGNANKLQEIFG